jgi:MFS family permease
MPRINFSRQQWLTSLTFVVVNLCNAMCVSMQAPFYPLEAEKKGCVPSEYGLVFGIFELTVFLVSPLIGANLNRMGLKATLTIGIGTVGVTSICFGFLDRIEDGKTFLALSFTFRIIEACGNAAFLTGSFSMIAKEFPDNVATMFAILETFFGIGMILGPTVGGALYELGGFTLPFACLGSVLVASALFCSFMLPTCIDTHERTTEKPSMLQALKVPSICMAMYSVACAACSLGFIQATMEPHLRDFHMTPMVIGSMFVISGGVYGFSAPLWGLMCDKRPPKAVTFIGAILIAIAFCLLGPLPFLNIPKSVGIIIVGLIIHGLGLGAEVVAGFADAHKSAIESGFPDTIDTYGLVSGLWTSIFALGAFIGPSMAGILFDNIGFEWATLFIIIIHILVVILLIAFKLCHKGSGLQIKDDDPDELEDDQLVISGMQRPAYGAIAGDNGESGPSRRRVPGRTRKYSEAVSGSVAKSISMVYPQFMVHGVANSYINPPPSYAGGAIAGSVNFAGADTDALLQVPEDED